MFYRDTFVYPSVLKIVLLTFLSFGLLSACGGGGGGDDGQASAPVDTEDGADDSSGQNVNDLATTDCSVPIATIVEEMENNLPDSIPSWDQIACYTGDLTRLPLIDYSIMSSQRPPEEEYDPTSGESIESAFVRISDMLTISTEYYANTFNFPSNEVPPYLLNSTDDFTPEQWDQKYRAMAAFGIYIKSFGLRLNMAFFYPPSRADNDNGDNEWLNSIRSAEDYLQWWQEVYIPERVALAEIAEMIQAEYFQPWDVEVGQFLRTVSDTWLDTLTEEEQVATAQQTADLLLAALRPVFSGTLSVISYDRYAAVGTHWEQIDLSAWDQVQFVLFTEGDVEATQIYLDEQLSGYRTMIERDGIERWLLQEVSVIGDNHQRLLPAGVNFTDIEADIYTTVFNVVEQLADQPDGIGVTAGFIESQAAETVVKDYLSEKSESAGD